VIQWAFRQWRETSEFFPAISEIVTLVRRRKIEIIERLETKRQREEAIEREEARAANRASALPKIQSRRMPEADPDARAKLKRQAAEVADRKGKQ
jgi:sugar (pentulose or hexulose) kinase